MPPDDDSHKAPEEIETVDVESCNDEVPDSGSEMHHQQQQHQQQVHHANMPALSGSSSHSSTHSSSNGAGGGSGNSTIGANLHNSNSQPGKLDGILYRTACVINKDSGGMVPTAEDDVSTNVATTSTNSNSSSSSTTNWTEAHASSSATHGHISGMSSARI